MDPFRRRTCAARAQVPALNEWVEFHGIRIVYCDAFRCANVDDCGNFMSKQRINWYKYAAPANFYPFAGKMIPFFAVPAGILFVVGLYVGFFVAPTDAVQGESYRILFIHVPAAWMGMFLYVLMAVYAGIGWAFNARLGSMMATAIAPTGAIFTFISLVTGSLWGRPAWGVYWVWDARMTSTLILMFLYIGFISLQSSIEYPRR